MQIDTENSRGRVVATGCLAPETAAELTFAALQAAAARKLGGLVLNFKDLSLTRSLEVMDCHKIGEQLARDARPVRRIAFVLRLECIEHASHLCTVASNRGLAAAAFEHESQAIAWLLAR
jgi:hypothetical protein